MDAAIYALIALSVIFAIACLIPKDLIYAVLFFCLMCITLAALYWVFNAPYVAVFQLTIYAGAVVALFVATIMLTARR